MTASHNHGADTPLDNPTSLFEERLAALRQLAPELFVGSVDGVPTVAAIQAFLGEEESSTKGESFELSWVGKAEAKRGAGLAPKGTLVPDADTVSSQNIIIEGDNLEVLRILRKSYAGKIKLIYIDPPYNTGNDFVYPDNYAEPVADYLRRSGAVDGDGRQLTANTRADGRFHAKWLSMMYPRLVLARELLRDDGVIFVSIDDNEVHHLRAIMNEIFGEENFVASVVWQKIHSTKNDAKYFSDNHEYILIYVRSIDELTIHLLDRTEEMDSRYLNPDNDPRGAWSSGDLVANETRAGGNYEIVGPTGRIFTVPSDKHWVYSKDKMMQLLEDNRLYFGKNGDAFPRKKRYLSEVQQGKKPDTLWSSIFAGNNQEGKREVNSLFDGTGVFDTPKPIKLLSHMLKIVTHNQSNDIILDFFAGSGTTAHAVMAQNAADGGNRKFILVQYPEPLNPANNNQKTAAEFCDSIGKPRTIAEITKERVRRAAAKIRSEHPMFAGDVGFQSFKLVNSFIKPMPRRTYSDREMQAAVEDMFASRLHKGWNVDGLATELLLREGFPLTSVYTVVDGWRVYTSDEVGYPLYINLAESIASVVQFVSHLAGQGRVGVNKRHGVAVCLDRAINTTDRVNLAEYVTIKTL